MANSEPIFSFGGLKRTLTELGYQVQEARPWTPISPVTVTAKDIEKGKLEIREDESSVGMYFIDSNGVKHVGFLYLQDYKLDEYGPPKYHLCNCATIQDFKLKGYFHKYRWANTESVTVINRNTGVEVRYDHLELCKNCISMIRALAGHVTFQTSEQFVEFVKNKVYGNETVDNDGLLDDLGEAAIADDIKKELGLTGTDFGAEYDIFGYVHGWEQISKAYREKHDYTCERCGIHIEDPLDRRFIHVHHKDGNKANNSESNLECLCIDCHSHVDTHHEQNFSSGSNHILLQSFRRKYKNKVDE